VLLWQHDESDLKALFSHFLPLTLCCFFQHAEYFLRGVTAAEYSKDTRLQQSLLQHLEKAVTNRDIFDFKIFSYHVPLPTASVSVSVSVPRSPPAPEENSIRISESEITIQSELSDYDLAER